MINVVIIDDEVNARMFLANLLEKELGAKLHLVESCSSVQEGVQAIKNNKVDLVFLDIQMPEEDGFQLMQYFEEINFEVIFVTAYDRYAIRAFECSALHYLLKPLDPEKVRQAITRFQKTREHKQAILEKFDVFTDYLDSKRSKERIVFNTPTGFEVVVLKDILYVEAAGNYCQFYFQNKAKKLVTSSMKAIEECLPEKDFCRVHNSYIINLNEVRSFVNADKEVKLRDGTLVKVSERKLAYFKNRISEMA